jgi:hypothetical protein
MPNASSRNVRRRREKVLGFRWAQATGDVGAGITLIQKLTKLHSKFSSLPESIDCVQHLLARDEIPHGWLM